jgi:acyl carrier protein
MNDEQIRKELTTKVIEIIFTCLNLKHIQKSSVNESTPLGEGGLALDSIDVLELIVNFEETFKIKLAESESYAKFFKTVGSVVDFVLDQTKTQKQIQS